MSVTIWVIGMTCILAILAWVRKTENDNDISEDSDECLCCEHADHQVDPK